MPDSNTSSPTPDGPVRFIPSDHTAPPPQPGLALCLSGGGYRAMVFHLGALIRLNQAGLLSNPHPIETIGFGVSGAAH
jgi:NTE family protein